MRKIEVCCASVEDVIAALQGGASRIELCQAIGADGVTPSYGLLHHAIEVAGEMPVNVLIRPREGNFVYSNAEIEIMRSDIIESVKAGASGIVIGALTPSGLIDTECMKHLTDVIPDNISITFHRAFDSCSDPLQSLEDVIDLGCNRILTSGLRPTAIEGVDLLSELVRKASDRIIIMPGGGINPSNISAIESITKAREFHSTATNKTIDRLQDSLFGYNPRHTSTVIVRQLVG